MGGSKKKRRRKDSFDRVIYFPVDKQSMRTAAAAAAGGLVSVSKAGVLRERAFILTKFEAKILLPRKVWKNAAQTLNCVCVCECVWGG